MDIVSIQVKDANGQWTNVCQEPLRNAIFDLDFHGFFYAGAKIRLCAKAYNPQNTFISSLTSTARVNSSIVMTMNNKPLGTDSFEWRTSVNGKNQSEAITINKTGFINTSGRFINASSGSFSKPWQTGDVFAVGKKGNDFFPLGNTFKTVPFAQTKNVVADNFGGRYHYLDGNQDTAISAFISSDTLLSDKTGATNDGSGNKNFALMKFTSLSDISQEIGGIEECELSASSVFDSRFADSLSDTVHTFAYGKYLGRPAGTTSTITIGGTSYQIATTKLTSATSDYGKSRKQMAFLGLASDGPNFVKGSDGSRSVANSSEDCATTMTFVKNPQDLSTIIAGTVITAINDDKDSIEKIGSVEFKYDIEPKKVKRIRCFPFNVESLSTKKGNGVVLANGVTNSDIGCTLTEVKFASKKANFNSEASTYSVGNVIGDDDDYKVVIDDSAFAYCMSLSSVSIPSYVSMNGKCTFFMNEVVDSSTSTTFGKEMYLSSTTTGSKLCVLEKDMIPAITAVQFNGNHIEEINGSRALLSTFSRCENLKSANIVSTDAESLAYTFYKCPKLISAEMPSTLTSIGPSSFYGCSNLMSVIIDSGIQTINNYAFKNVPRFADNAITSTTNKFMLDIVEESALTADKKKYFLAIKLSGEVGSYRDDTQINPQTVAGEISDCVNVMLKNNNTTGSLGSSGTSNTNFRGRRFFLMDKDGNFLTDLSSQSVKAQFYVYSPYDAGSTSLTSFNQSGIKKYGDSAEY